jgi:hypothetical protein
MGLCLNADAHQLMVGRVIRYLVNTITESIVRLQFRRKPIG